MNIQNRREPSALHPKSFLTLEEFLRLSASLLILIVISASVTHLVFPQAETSRFRISLAESGVYRVTFEDLVEAGLESKQRESAKLSLSNQGQPVPVWLADGGDQHFGPGDWIEFVGTHLAGKAQHSNPYSNRNVYLLDWDGNKIQRMIGSPPPPDQQIATGDASGLRARRDQHLEHDRFLIRLSSHEVKELEEPEVWFWTKLTHIDSEPFEVPLNLSDLDPSGGATVSLRIHFRGLSNRFGGANDNVPGHRVEISLNGSLVGPAEWDGRSLHLQEFPSLDAGRFIVGDNKLEFAVPARTVGDQKDPIVDAVMLDWVEISYTHSGLLAADQVELNVSAESPGLIRMIAADTRGLVAYGDGGKRVEALERPSPAQADQPASLLFQPEEGEKSYHLVRDGQFKHPDGIELDSRSHLKDRPQQADYLMIAHRRLLEAATPLAEYHRSKGLRVALIDVQDLYDEFNHSIVHPIAIRDFIAHAYENWMKPAPRFVLLVGDASWDTKNSTIDDANYANYPYREHNMLWGVNALRSAENPDRWRGFVPKDSAVYPESKTATHRNLIPTQNYHSPEGHSASDNWFVALKEKDFHPVIAIGRFPVVEPEEVRAIVDKTLRYMKHSDVGPWRRNSLWITNEQRGFHQASDHLAGMASKRGLGVQKVYPLPEEKENAAHQSRLRDAFDEGQLLVHFYGHGGRYIWRTGPPDLKKNHDLFTLDDIEKLKPNDRLPVVLSMTCFSAPFDHPNADSIGEKFLRLPDRGAVAVLAASWRNSPSQQFSQELVNELTQPGTIGEAILRAKQRIRNRVLVEQYNLLGDPAAPIAVPERTVKLTAVRGDVPALSVKAEIESPAFRGQAIIDWLGKSGEVTASQQLEVAESHFEVAYPGEQEQLNDVEAVRVYVWDEKGSVDGVGQLDIPPLSAAASAAVQPR